MHCLKESLSFSNWRSVYFVWPLEHLIKKLPVPTKLAIVVVIKAKSRQAFLHVLWYVFVAISNHFRGTHF